MQTPTPDATPDEIEQFNAVHKLIAWRAGATMYQTLYPNAAPPDMHERLLALHFDLQIAPGIVNATARCWRDNLGVTDDWQS